jgi:hypothetical protein
VSASQWIPAERVALWRRRGERALPVARTAGFVVSLGIVVVMVFGAVDNVRDAHLSWPWLVPAAVAVLVWWALLARAWALLASGAATRSDMGAWCRTQALRYLPGGIWAPVSRVAVAGGRPLDRISTVTAENVISLTAALAVGGVALAAAGGWAWGLLLLAPAVPVVATALTRDRTRLTRERVLAVTTNNLAAFAAYALAAVLAQAAVSGFHDAAFVAGAAALAWSAGLVVVVSPSGAGVREVTYVALATDSVSRADAVTASVALRAATVIVELAVLAVVARPVKRSQSGSSEAENPLGDTDEIRMHR